MISVFQTPIMEEEAWKKDDIRQLVVSQLREALEKYEGLGYLAEQIEECCFRESKSEQEYNDTLGKLTTTKNRKGLTNNFSMPSDCVLLVRRQGKVIDQAVFNKVHEK